MKFKKIPKIIVPKTVVHSLYSYVTRGPDNSFSYERGATYFHGITSRIVIGNTVYVEELGVVGHDYDDILFSIMCLATLSRLRRTKTFGEFVRKIDNEFSGNSFKPPFVDDVKNLWISFKQFIIGDNKRGLLFNREGSFDFIMYDMAIFDDVFCNDVIKARYQTVHPYSNIMATSVKKTKTTHSGGKRNIYLCFVCHNRVCVCLPAMYKRFNQFGIMDGEVMYHNPNTETDFSDSDDCSLIDGFDPKERERRHQTKKINNFVNHLNNNPQLINDVNSNQNRATLS